MSVLTHPAYDAPVDVEVLPLDPASLDATRPVDIDVCGECMGDRCIVTFDQGEGQSDECWACNGTGLRGAW